MGKKIKKKGRNAPKERRSSSSHCGKVSAKLSPSATKAAEETLASGEKACHHRGRSFDIDKIAWSIGGLPKCEDCAASARHKGKAKGKKCKREMKMNSSRSEPQSMWVCLDCGHLSCGGSPGEQVSRGHAFRHARQSRHPWMAYYDSTPLLWCALCNSAIPVQSDEENNLSDLALCEVLNLIREQFVKVHHADAEDAWMQGNMEDRRLENEEGSFSDGRDYMVHGLANLGNTCFFNSILQNILAMGILRKYFTKLSKPEGPLTMALKKLYGDTGPEAKLKNCLNPKGLFGCICSKAPQFGGYQQQDSHELLRYLLDGLSAEEINAKRMTSSDEDADSSSTDCTFVDIVFGGQISSTVFCLECGHSSVVYEPFLDLSLPLPSNRRLSKKTSASRPKRGKQSLKEKNRFKKVVESKMPDSHPSLLNEVKSSSMNGSLEYAESSSIGLESSRACPETLVPLTTLCQYSWMDFVGESSDSRHASSPSHNCDLLGNQPSEDGVKMQNDSRAAKSIDDISFPCNDAHLGILSVAKVSGEVKHPEHIQEREDLSLHYNNKAEEQIANEVREADENTKDSVSCCEEFDGLSDLFNEPDVATDSQVGFNTNEGTEPTVLDEKSSESDQDELDNTNSQVTVESCLAFFIKPEVLSGEHAWICEKCSKILKQQKKTNKYDITSANGKARGLRTLDHRCDEHIVISNKLAYRLDEDAPHVSNSENLDHSSLCQMKKLEHAHACVLENCYSPAGSSNLTTCELGQERYFEISKSSAVPGLPSEVIDPFQSEEDATPNHVHQPCESLQDTEMVSSDVEGHNPATEVVQAPSRVSKLQTEHEETSENFGQEVGSKCFVVKREATKRILIKKAPAVLSIQLKRFGQDDRGRLNKLSGHVSFREMLDLTPYMDPRDGERNRCSYQLIGVVEHSGTLRGGHYVAYIRGEKNRGKDQKNGPMMTWFCANDAFVHEVSFAEVLQSEAYMLFYEKI